MPYWHDEYRPQGSLAVSSVASTATYSTASTGAQTRAVRIAATGAAGSGVYFSLVDSGVTSTTGVLLPLGMFEYIKCNPGEKVFFRGDSTTCIVNVIELTD